MYLIIFIRSSTDGHFCISKNKPRTTTKKNTIKSQRKGAGAWVRRDQPPLEEMGITLEGEGMFVVLSSPV